MPADVTSCSPGCEALRLSVGKKLSGLSLANERKFEFCIITTFKLHTFIPVWLTGLGHQRKGK